MCQRCKVYCDEPMYDEPDWMTEDAERAILEHEWNCANLPGYAELCKLETKYPDLDFELTDDGVVVCTTCPNP